MRRSVKIFWQIFFGGFIAFILLVLLASWGVFGKMPSLQALENPSILQATEVFADDGTLMGKYYLEKGNRSNVDYKDISPYVVNALVSTEDERFYSHSGIDFKSTLRAIMLLGREGGGSTITQQLAKALLDHEAKKGGKAIRVIQKLKEWIIAVKLERNFTKDEIIALYLNAVPYSDNVFGIRNAARTFFQKEPDQLNVEEAALLVGMINGPGLYNPRRNAKAALDRRNLVIRRMEEHGKISPEESRRLKTTPIRLNYRKLDENTGYAPYFREVLREDLKNILKDIKKPDGDSYDIYDDALKVYTTINPRMQEYAEESIAEWMPTMQKYLNSTGNIKSGAVWEEYESVLQAAMKSSDRWANMKDEGYSDDEIKRAFKKKVPMKVFAWNSKREKDTVMTPFDSIRYHKQIMQASFMAMDPVTGEIKAWVGGVSFKTFKYDHVNIKTKRQVGSSIKPFLYAEAMELGMRAEDPVEDVQQDFGHGRLVPATTKSCTGRTMTMASALAWSKNCASAYIMKQVGPEAFETFVNRLGVPTDIGPHPANALGACDLSLYEMLWGYTVFAGGGFSTKPWYISRIEDRNGNVIKRFDYSVNRKEAISQAIAYKMVRMMQGTVDAGTASGLRSRLGAAEMGGKTGTTNDNSDAWFMGYTPQLLAGVWVGCDDRFIRLNKNDTRGYGGTAARPIWEAFYKKVYADKKLGIDRDARFSKPDDLELEMNSADPLNLLDQIPPPAAEGEDQGVGNEEDFEIQKPREYIGPESKPVKDDDKKPQKDNEPIISQPAKIGEPEKDTVKKKNLFQRIFGKKKKGDGQ